MDTYYTLFPPALSRSQVTSRDVLSGNRDNPIPWTSTRTRCTCSRHVHVDEVGSARRHIRVRSWTNRTTRSVSRHRCAHEVDQGHRHIRVHSSSIRNVCISCSCRSPYSLSPFVRYRYYNTGTESALNSRLGAKNSTFRRPRESRIRQRQKGATARVQEVGPDDGLVKRTRTAAPRVLNRLCAATPYIIQQIC